MDVTHVSIKIMVPGGLTSDTDMIKIHYFAEQTNWSVGEHEMPTKRSLAIISVSWKKRWLTMASRTNVIASIIVMSQGSSWIRPMILFWLHGEPSMCIHRTREHITLHVSVCANGKVIDHLCKRFPWRKLYTGRPQQSPVCQIRIRLHGWRAGSRRYFCVSPRPFG